MFEAIQVEGEMKSRELDYVACVDAQTELLKMKQEIEEADANLKSAYAIENQLDEEDEPSSGKA